VSPEPAAVLAAAGALAGLAIGEAVADAIARDGRAAVRARLLLGEVGGTGEAAPWRFGARTAAALDAPVAELLAEPPPGPAGLHGGGDPAGALLAALDHDPVGAARRIGAAVGITGLPSRWTTYLRGTHGGRPVGTEHLLAHAAEGLGTSWPGFDPGPDPLGPVRLPEGIWVANYRGALAAPAELAVVSLCPVGSTMDHHEARRAPLLTDLGPDWNPRAGDVVLDALDAIDAFRAEGREVLVHCAYGHSRTGLVLRAWLARTLGLTPSRATALAQDRWRWVHTRNGFFTAVLDDLYRSGRLDRSVVARRPSSGQP
jgi:hypothetical protein